MLTMTRLLLALGATLALTALAQPSRPPPGEVLKGRLVLESYAGNTQTLLLTSGEDRWVVECLPSAVLQQLLGKDVELEGVLRDTGAAASVRRICAHKVVVPPSKDGKNSVDAKLLGLGKVQ